MIIIEDTRQQTNKHNAKHKAFTDAGDRVFRCKLIVGDYCIAPSVSVDTKQDIKEIASNMCGSIAEKQRFARECKIANEIGCKLVFLIEDNKYKCIEDLYGKKIWMHSKSVIQGDQLALAMITMQNRYGVEFQFCSPNETADRIKQILTNEKGGETDGE